MVFQRSQIEEVANHIRAAWKPNPRVGIVLGSGLGASVESMDVEVEFEYGDLPHFPRSTAVGHRGRLLAGELAGLPVIAMQGRFHLYEGYTPQQVTFPIRVMRGLGADLLIVCNAAGGLHSTYAAGDIMAIDDHINMMFQNPLIGINDDRLGPRFPDMSSPYDPALIQQVMQIAREHDFTCHRGVYIGMLGPNYETRAEYRFLRRFGGHVVGMSTVPEVLAAVHAGMRVLGLSMIANVATPDNLAATSGAEVVAVADRAANKVATIIHGIISQFGAELQERAGH
jgi:purine-nucleoside phosphorylase